MIFACFYLFCYYIEVINDVLLLVLIYSIDIFFSLINFDLQVLDLIIEVCRVYNELIDFELSEVIFILSNHNFVLHILLLRRKRLVISDVFEELLVNLGGLIKSWLFSRRSHGVFVMSFEKRQRRVFFRPYFI